METDGIRTAVRKTYGDIALGRTSGCCDPGCCGLGDSMSQSIGYLPDELATVPATADLGLGCGNPHAIAELRSGERVLDLGSGAGLDALLAARQVGRDGHVIGVDMTPEMITKARANATITGLANVEFRLGEIEHLPVADSAIDVVMSNCVINLSPDKEAVFREAFRVLVPGGRLAIWDIVTIWPLPAAIVADLDAYTGCVAGAALIADLQLMLSDVGFRDVSIEVAAENRAALHEWPSGQVSDYIATASIRGIKGGSSRST